MPKLLATQGEGERLDRFELVAELASGGMATVFLARLSGVAGFQRLVAIKRLHPHLAKQPDFVEMFLDEARLAARIHHPNVVPIQEVGESKSGYYLVMDYVEGDTLAHLLSRASQSKRQVPWGVVIRIALDTLAGLHAAHELKDDRGQPLAIVHRDVSPQNVLVGSDGIARITDFGVARAASRLSTTRSGQLKGKLAYMAPEQARGEATDRRADIFSCGIVLWEALTMKRLFRGDGEAATLNRVLHDPIAPPSSVRSDVPRELDAVCMKALERDIDQRFPTADAFADELERVARKLSCVGSGRDVAACLEDVFGSDLAEQRDAVRAWLARSEPSGVPHSRKSIPDSAQTRVEGKESFAPRGMSEHPPNGGVDRQAVTAPGPLEAVSGSLPPEKVTSVSSTVLPVTGVDTGAVPAVEASRLPSTRVIAIASVAAVLIGVAAWGAGRLGASKEAPRAATVPAATQAPPLPPAIVVEPAKPSTAPSVPTPESSTAPHASATATAPLNRPGAKKLPSAVPRSTTVPSSASRATTSMPDDLSKNPYR